MRNLDGKILFFGSPEEVIPVLEKIVLLFGQKVLVITKPPSPAGRGMKLKDTPVKVKAENMGLSVMCPSSLKEREFIEKIRDFSPDVGICAAYGKLVPPSILHIPEKGIINIHPSLLPRWRGAAPVQRAIENGDKYTGISFALMTEGLDDGPVLYQEKIVIQDNEDAPALMKKLMLRASEVLENVIEDYLAGKIKPVPQAGEITYAPKLKKEEGRIDWNLSSRTIFNKMRGFCPWPGIYTFWEKRLIKIWGALPLEENSGEKPGTVVKTDNEGIYVQCGEGILKIIELQMEGKRRMNADAFLRGNRLLRGNILG